MNNSRFTSKFNLIRLILAFILPKVIARQFPQKFLKRIYHDKKFSVIIAKSKFSLTGTKNSFENSIYWNSLAKSVEGFSIELLSNLLNLKNRPIFWDVGANSGVYTLIVRTLKPNSLIVAFEPSKMSQKKLIHNLSDNGYEYTFSYKPQETYCNLILLNYALGSKNERLQFNYYSADDDFTYGGQVLELNKKSSKTEFIDSLTATEIIDSNNNLLPNFIKMDIEGYEFEALLGFGAHIKKLEVILIEILSDNMAEKIETLLTPHLFRYFDIDDRNRTVKEFSHLKKSSFRNWFVVKRDNNPGLALIKSQYLDV